MGIEADAAKHLDNYASSILLGSDGSTLEAAKAILDCYLPGFTAFTMGDRAQFNSPSDDLKGIDSYLQIWVKHGIGLDMRVQSHRIEPVSPFSALCWATWEVFPKDGTKGWTWENCYGYRKGEKEEGWELVIADNETLCLSQNRPDLVPDLQKLGAKD